MARPLARGARKALAWGQRTSIAWSALPGRGDLQVSYGHRRIPGPDEAAVGGIVKLQSLERVFPNSPRRFNLLYLVTSRLPEDAVPLAETARRKGAKVVINQNGVAYAGWYGPGWERVNAPMAGLLAIADHVFYQSEFCRRAADEFLGTPGGSWEILYNAVDLQTFVPAVRPERRPLTLLLGGSQDLWYRFETGLRVLAAVSDHYPEARLIVAGRLRWVHDGAAARGEADRLARELGVADRVSFLGPYAQRDAAGIYQQADILVHTKYNDPCPAVVIEAMACGLPVVYSGSGGVPELVGPDAGLAVPAPLDWDHDHAPDVGLMADAVCAIAADRVRYCAAARHRAAERFDARHWLDRHRIVFANLVSAT